MQRAAEIGEREGRSSLRFAERFKAEAARILGLGIETVRFYVKQARAAYDVVSRTQLVVTLPRAN